jgi:hypothetical protein
MKVRDMSQFKRPVILYFIADASPTEEEREAAAAFGVADVRFRNAAAVVATEKPEGCDGVAGLVPDNYANTYPTVEAGDVPRLAKTKAAKALADNADQPQEPKPGKPLKQPAKPEETPQPVAAPEGFRMPPNTVPAPAGTGAPIPPAAPPVWGKN